MKIYIVLWHRLTRSTSYCTVVAFSHSYCTMVTLNHSYCTVVGNPSEVNSYSTIYNLCYVVAKRNISHTEWIWSLVMLCLLIQWFFMPIGLPIGLPCILWSVSEREADGSCTITTPCTKVTVITNSSIALPKKKKKLHTVNYKHQLIGNIQ